MFWTRRGNQRGWGRAETALGLVSRFRGKPRTGTSSFGLLTHLGYKSYLPALTKAACQVRGLSRKQPCPKTSAATTTWPPEHVVPLCPCILERAYHTCSRLPMSSHRHHHALQRNRKGRYPRRHYSHRDLNTLEDWVTEEVSLSPSLPWPLLTLCVRFPYAWLPIPLWKELIPTGTPYLTHCFCFLLLSD